MRINKEVSMVRLELDREFIQSEMDRLREMFDKANAIRCQSNRLIAKAEILGMQRYLDYIINIAKIVPPKPQ